MRIATMGGDLTEATSGQAVVLQLDRDIDISRGAVLAVPKQAPKAVEAIDARLAWLADTPFVPDQDLLLRSATDLVPIERITIKARLDLATLAQTPGVACGPNDIALANIRFGRPVVLDRFTDAPETGMFVLVDALSGATVAGGIARALTEQTRAPNNDVFRLTRGLLADGVCAGLAPDDPEFRHRAEAVQRLFARAGLDVGLDLDAL